MFESVTQFPKQLGFMCNKLFSGQTTHTQAEKVVIYSQRYCLLKIYRLKRKVNHELLGKLKPYCKYKINGTLYNFIRLDNYNNNGFIKLLCTNNHKLITARKCPEVIQIWDTFLLDRKYKTPSQKIYMNHIIYK